MKKKEEQVINEYDAITCSCIGVNVQSGECTC